MIERTLFTDEHHMFRDSVRKFVEQNVTPYHAQWEEDGMVSREVWKQAGEQGLLGCDVPEEYGGAGADFLFSVIVMEELARANAFGPGFSLHSDIVMPYFIHYASEDLKKKWLPKMTAGEAIGAIAMTEPAGGSDLQNLKTSAVRDGDDYIINGQKVFISNGQMADLVLVACKTDKNAGAKGISLILVEADREGFDKGKNLDKLGWKAQDTSELFFDNVRVPAGNLIGEVEGRGFYQMMEQLPQERLMQAVRATSNLEAALEWTVEYVTERKAFGGTIADLQHTRFKLADVKTQAVMLRVFTDRCIDLHLQKKLDGTDAAMVKMVTSETLGKCLDDCLQMFGGYGYMTEYAIARAWVDARMTRIAGGACEIMREIIGRSIVGRGK
ncbi:acyl-CoA dehydrogenase family protein [Sulfitobacter sp. F26169L]|uniref:acyl-CoA dehydrogenase family protein n=1 Tax=Sulfitobacter sp. F26169L TaxID=2996015 RepID=UPI002260ECED|nr:acyl-CoA dehydrogenase family protein [Sulfitobacter sp. F26169L]MCX7568096.1 acyl-CoA dehydrogenase family protein [Sulfitobacter sp. F26169L]